MNRTLLVNGSFSGLWKSLSLIIKIIPATVGRSILCRVFSQPLSHLVSMLAREAGRPGQGTLPLERGTVKSLAQSSVPGEGPTWAGSQGSDFKLGSCQDI